MSKAYYIKDAESNKFEELLEKELKPDFKKGMSVAVKLHLGHGKGMFRPELAERAVGILNKFGCKPFLYDTPVAYPGKRDTKGKYEKTAAGHGYTQEKIGCPIIISDDYVIVKTEHMDIKVSKEHSEADALLVLTHVKGHPASAVGGAIKNLAMGCVSPKSNEDQHSIGIPDITDDCTACGICAEACPFKVIKMEDKAVIDKNTCLGCSTCFYSCPNEAITCTSTFDRLMAEAAFAALSFFKGKPVYYVNDIRSITRNCDCFDDPGEIIARDVGVLLSDNLVAIDKASVDLVAKQEGKDIFEETHKHDPCKQVKEAAKMGLGREEYGLFSV